MLSTFLMQTSPEYTEKMCTWDISDGRCIESVRLQFIHTKVQSYQMIGHETTVLFCNGYYSEILILNLQTLETLFTLTSKLNPDWISIHACHSACKTTRGCHYWSFHLRSGQGLDSVRKRDTKFRTHLRGMKASRSDALMLSV